MVVIDAKGAVVGRLGARVAKLLLSGQQVEIINADKAVMSGSLSAAKEKYFSRRSQKNKRNPDESPKWPRVPHLLLRRIIRGMLPWKSRRGREAYRRLRVVSGELEGKSQAIKEASSEGKQGTFTLSQLCLELGGPKKW
ncbi:MAG: 50S ribosomal protein L13 [Candidatus Micrarchaeota archaeon]|nr:50S ribosomal protein L13 [Candidatus Micrarchaeota archaeon]